MMMSYETDNCNNNVVIGEHLLTKPSNNNIIPSEFQQEESEKQLVIDNNMVRFNVNQNQEEGKAEGDVAIMNYAYDPGLVDTSVICDLGFRNMDSLDELTQEDLLNLMEKTYMKLSLTHNCLVKISNGFFRQYPRLAHLSVLDLSCNQLEYLPNDIGLLTSLTYLNLFLNNLRTIPSSMGRLSNLKWLNLNKNPDLFKTSYFRILAGPMSNDKECFTCAKNVVLWINQVNDRRLNAFRYESVGDDVKPLRDSHLIQNGPQEETNEQQPIPTTGCSKIKSFIYCCMGFTAVVGILTVAMYFLMNFYKTFYENKNI